MERKYRLVWTARGLCVVVLLAVGATSSAAVTFNKDIAPIVFQNCVTCHRPGEVAPFSLLTYPDVRRHAKELAELTRSRTMPPWKPGDGFGEFANVRRLTPEQIGLIQQWVKDGREQGDAKDLPATPTFPDGWALGEPDLVLRMPKAYTVQADGPDQYHVFVLPLDLPEDKYVTAVDFRPGNRKIVHHSLFYFDTSGKARELEAESTDKPGYPRTGSPGFTPAGGLGGWAPGVMPKFLPDGVAHIMPAHSDLILHTHFHPSGKIESVQSTIGLYFAKQPPRKLFLSLPHGSHEIDISPGDSHYQVDESFTVPRNVELEGIFPHAHLLCRQIKVTATLPDGTSEPLIWIKDWDWNWQGQYEYSHPLQIPKGTEVRMQFTYDNSEANIHNPNRPPQRVRWGEQTGDEMALVFFDLLIDREQAERLGAMRRMFRGRRPATQPSGGGQ